MITQPQFVLHKITGASSSNTGERITGRFTYHNGDSYHVCSLTFLYVVNLPYQGEVLNGIRDGYGVYSYSDGRKYIGYWKDNQSAFTFFFYTFSFYRFHGAGSLQFPNGQKYSCQYVNGKVASEITIQYPNGDSYVGEVKGITIHGKGTFKTHDGNFVYEGEWKRQKQHGKGTMTVYNQQHEVVERYCGDWFEGKKQGKGSYICQDGVSYEGSWADDHVCTLWSPIFSSFSSFYSARRIWDHDLP